MGGKRSLQKKRKKCQDQAVKAQELKSIILQLHQHKLTKEAQSSMLSFPLHQSKRKKLKNRKRPRENGQDDESYDLPLASTLDTSCESIDDVVVEGQDTSQQDQEVHQETTVQIVNAGERDASSPLATGLCLLVEDDPGPDNHRIRRQPHYQNVPVDRDFEINKRRIKLPAYMMEQEIVDATRNNDVVLITGDTGCGKSTQVPQFLYENGLCHGNLMIGVTQIRRVACLALCQQISLELSSKELVGYQVRYNKSFNANLCKIKFMTDGILMQELKEDLLCRKYSVLIIDEAHERSVNCDILIGVLSKVVAMRRKLYDEDESEALPPLKLIIMSATIHKEVFLGSNIFPNIVHLHIPTKSQATRIHYNRKTPSDYVLDAKDKVIKIHQRLPPGSILVFLTGKDELVKLKNMLQQHFKNYRKRDTVTNNGKPSSQFQYSASEETTTLSDSDSIYDLLSDDEGDDDSGSNVYAKDKGQHGIHADDFQEQEHATGFVSQDENESDDRDGCTPVNTQDLIELEILSKSYKRISHEMWQGSDGSGRLKTVLLHASQDMNMQMAAFESVTDDERVVILSTNVAETSVTLPNIRYVVDCGKEKQRSFDLVHGISRYVISDISKASANQRSGRAGRLGPGHCYRCYTSSVYENVFADNSPIEIEKCNLEPVLLFLASIGIENPYSFPYLTPPPRVNIQMALRHLAILGAIQVSMPTLPNKRQKTPSPNHVLSCPFKVCPYYPQDVEYAQLDGIRTCIITKLGRCLSLIPMNPRFAKAIYGIMCRSKNLIMGFLVTCAMSFGGGALIFPSGKEFKALPKFRNDVEEFAWICCQYSSLRRTRLKDAQEFCREYGINSKALQETFLQAEHVYNIIKIHFGNVLEIENFDWARGCLEAPSLDQLNIIREALVECLIDKIAILGEDKNYKSAEMLSGNVKIYLPVVYSKKAFAMVAYNYLLGCATEGNGNNEVGGVCRRVRMQDIMETDAAELSTFKSPLVVSRSICKTPRPVYSADDDGIHAYIFKVYGPLDLDLGAVKCKLPPLHPLAIKTFAQHLAFGLIYEELSIFKSDLAVTWDSFLEPIGVKNALFPFLAIFFRFGISSKAALQQHLPSISIQLADAFCPCLLNGKHKSKVMETFKELI